MPYKVIKNGSEDTPFCVYKIGDDDQPTGKSLGCHPTKSEADDQISAILISESEGKESMTKPLSYLRAFPVRQIEAEQDTNLPIRFVASTEGKKADGIDLKTSDWLLGRFEKHPVILYAHDYFGTHLPLGSGQPIIDGSRLLMDVTFDNDDPFARSVRAKTVKGLMGGSVGWQPTDKGNELLEFSIVPVPLDPDALPMRQMSGRRALQEWLDQQAQELTGKGDSGADSLLPDGLEGEARSGAVLSARNLKDLEQAVDLINSVIERAKKEEKPPDEKEEDKEAERTIAALQNIYNSLNQIGA